MNKHLRLKVGCLMVVSLVFGAGAATAKDTKLDGTLTIDFNVPDSNPTIPAGYIFTVAKDKKYSLYDPSGTAPAGSEFPVPEAIRGGTFALNVECTNAMALDTTAGASQLRVKQKNDRGTVYRALVTSGAFWCLAAGGATRVDAPFDDPFLGNFGLESLAGERGVWLTQILDAAENAGTEGVNTLRTFFEIPATQTVVEPKYKTVEVSSYLNRGGSAAGIVNSDIELKFKEPKK